LKNLEQKKIALSDEVSMLKRDGMSMEDVGRIKVESRKQKSKPNRFLFTR